MSWQTEIEELDPIDHDETARCAYHPDKEAEGICDQCGKRICGLDMKQSGTIELCNECFEDNARKPIRGPVYSILLASVPIFLVVFLFVFVRRYL